MSRTDVKCPHCAYDFPTPKPGAGLLPLWAWFGLIVLCAVAIAFDFGDWLEVVVGGSCLAFVLLCAAWRRWNRYWNRR